MAEKTLFDQIEIRGMVDAWARHKPGEMNYVKRRLALPMSFTSPSHTSCSVMAKP
jgi:hypothetical protein